jgi:hypothetical protein
MDVPDLVDDFMDTTPFQRSDLDHHRIDDVAGETQANTSITADFGRIRTLVSVESVHLFRSFRTPREGAFAATGVM